MTLQEIVDASRDRLGNYEKPWNWLDREIVLYANEAINVLCRDTRILEDSYTGSICNVHAAAGILDYALSTYIIYVTAAKLLSSEKMTLDVAATPAAWAVDATVTGGTSTFTCNIVAALTTTTYTIDKRTGEFTLGEILSDGTNSADQGAAYPVLTDNSSSPNLLTKSTSVEMNRYYSGWRSATATQPTKYILDYRHGYITLYPPPDKAYTIVLSVIRYPSAAFSATSMSSQTPEIPTQYHHALLDGIAWQAFLKRGEATYDPQKSDFFYKLFRKQISDMKIQSNMREGNESTNSPLGGFI